MSSVALSNFVKTRRESMHKSQKEVAQEVGIAQGTLSNLEIGKPIRLYPEIINGLSKSLGSTSEELIRLASSNASEEILLSLTRTAPRTMRKIVASNELVTAEDLTMLVGVREGFGEMFTIDLVIDLIQLRHRKEDSCSKAQ
jgi:transcriptional regulator with XRE-family HTH domain